jgi:hypothetical protein
MAISRAGSIRRLRSWGCAAAVCLAGVLGCGDQAAVQPPVNNIVSVPGVPSKSMPPKNVVEPGKSTDPGGGDPSVPSKAPSLAPYAPEQLDRLVAMLAVDDPARPNKRVWFRKDESQTPFISVALSLSLVNDEGLAKLSGIAGLRHLNLDDCREITSAGMAHLPLLKDLRKLSLNRTAVGDAGLAYLAQVPGLTELSLIGNGGVTDGGAAHLCRCQELRVLRLQDTRLGDKGLADLKAAPQLREVYLDGTRVTGKGIVDFEAARPGTQIIHPTLRPTNRKP